MKLNRYSLWKRLAVKSRGQRQLPRGSRFALTRGRLFFILCLLCIAPWVLVTLLATGSAAAIPRRAREFAAHRHISQQVRCEPGPWGDVEYTRLWVGVPEELLPAKMCEPQPTRWFFPNHTPDTLDALIRSVVKPASLQKEFMDRQRWTFTPAGIQMTPDERSILRLSATARLSLYRVLSAAEENSGQAHPFTMHRSQFSEWIRNSGLSNRSVHLLRKLKYETGETVMFSDTMALLTLVSVEERPKVITALGRSPVLLPRIRVSPETDTEALAGYWSRGGEKRSVAPLLQAIAHQPQGGTLDIAHLLTPFARKHLNAHPITSRLKGTPQDCYWSAANYFNHTIDNTVTNSDAFAEFLMERCVQVRDNPTYGDVVLFVNQAGTPVHASNYIAADIVFTKNGSSHRNGWILCALPDMLAGYGGLSELDVVYFRRKDHSLNPAGVDERHRRKVSSVSHVSGQWTVSQKSSAANVATGGDRSVSIARRPMPRPMPAEFEPHAALLLGCTSLIQRHPGVFVDVVAAVHRGTPIIGLVASSEESRRGKTLLRDGGLPEDAVSFVALPLETMWARDYGPIFLQSTNGSVLIADCELPIKPEKREEYQADDNVPTFLADAMGLETLPVPMYLVGGNLLSNGEGLCLFTTRLVRYNLTRGCGLPEIEVMLRERLGLTTPLMVTELAGEPTGDVDMFATFVAPNVVVIAQISPAVDARNARNLDEAAALLARQETSLGPMQVHRVPMPPKRNGRWRTYTNVAFANGVLLVPSYSDVEPAIETKVREMYAALLPDRDVVPIRCDNLADRRGLLHCITRDVPAFVPVERLHRLGKRSSNGTSSGYL